MTHQGLVPWMRREAAKCLRDPFIAAIPIRDF
jgi:hypothetical protein